jgi:type IX secretion system PorP/SprF family membrane protein
MKKQLLSLIFFGYAVIGFAQQLPLYSQYSAISYLYNPALAGIRDEVNATLLHRNQWRGIAGAPTTSLFSLEGPVPVENIGIAGTVFQDVTDITQRTGFYTSYSYKLKINEDQKLFLGASIGFLQQRIDLSGSVIRDENDPMLLNRDNLRKNFADATFGVAYTWKALEAGFAVPQLAGSKIQYSGTGAASYYYMARHFLTSLKYTFTINENQGMTAYPLVLVRYVKGAPVQYDVNGYFDWKKYGWAGITYRSGYAIGINVGFRVNNSLRAGYAYDYSINTVKNFIAGSHEFFLGYTFGQSKVKETEEVETASKNNDKDSLMEALRISDEKHMEEIIRMKESIALLKKQNDSAHKILSELPGMQFAKAADFKTEDGKPIEKGFYVVVGAFKNLLNAETAQKSNQKKYPKTDILFNKSRGFHYVYVSTFKDAKSAEEILKEVLKQYADAWIFDME